MAYDYGSYERQKNDVEYKYSNDAATNAYSRFLSQQRGQRSLGDMSREFGQQMPKFKARFGQRGLSGPGIRSGVMQNSMNNYIGNYTRDYGRMQQDNTQQLQQYDLAQNQSNAWRQQTLADLEAAKAQQIAAEAQNLEYLRQMVGGL